MKAVLSLFFTVGCVLLGLLIVSNPLNRSIEFEDDGPQKFLVYYIDTENFQIKKLQSGSYSIENFEGGAVSVNFSDFFINFFQNWTESTEGSNEYSILFPPENCQYLKIYIEYQYINTQNSIQELKCSDVLDSSDYDKFLY